VYNRVFGEIGSIDPALTVYFGAHQSIGCKGIVLFGNEEQKKKYLPGCASGERVAAFCLTEPGSGSDAQAMKSTARLSDDKTHYLLTGTKIWISNAGYADLFTVFAKVAVEIDGKTKQRVTAFIVDAHAAGVSLGKVEEKMGIKASDTRAVFFENVKVPVEDRLGDVGQGFHIALEILNSGRLGLAAGSARGARRIMREAIAYAKQRVQFGKPIISYQMIQQILADMTIGAQTCQLITYYAAWLKATGQDCNVAASQAKIYTTETARKVCQDGMQVMGGYGYLREFDMQRPVRDSLLGPIGGGTNQIQRLIIAKNL
jgi:alkylation response protein AidB-like acyl-CoA dehydrogenase